MATWIDYLIVFLRIVRFCVDYVVDLIFSLIYDRRPKAVIPPIDKPFLAYSGTKLAKLIRTKQLTSEEVTRAFAERCRQINSILNAIVDERFDDAIQDAKKVDEFLATTDMSESELAASKPFLGVPFTSKESTEAEGMSFTFGIISRKIQDMKGAVDSNVVNLLKQRGGILIAVTNVPELNLWCETRNNVFGQTVNCYDSRRTTGGSSGGEATLLAACGSAIGIGTDVGGSTRMPAYYCGIYGHKPTADLISTKGLTFRAGNETTTMVAAGPMSRHAEDLVPFLDVLVGENRSKLKLNDADLLGDDGVLLFPSGPREAPYHYESFLRPYNFAYWGIFNALKIPATNVPMGFSKNGLPIGLQVVAGPYNDHLCLAVARELEKEFGGWVPPFISN
ncbi:unnamed protein product [Nesidiocoris tenuis]|uniref:Amidase domain-containing protein n=1 Tax=Nesidiocoris tenuis TaxID=355587 RepID=A0A6H5HA13_9HEMI|nr:unnamed protein product [Nesidiocoris tenuis]